MPSLDPSPTEPRRGRVGSVEAETAGIRGAARGARDSRCCRRTVAPSDELQRRARARSHERRRARPAGGRPAPVRSEGPGFVVGPHRRCRWGGGAGRHDRPHAVGSRRRGLARRSFGSRRLLDLRGVERRFRFLAARSRRPRASRARAAYVAAPRAARSREGRRARGRARARSPLRAVASACRIGCHAVSTRSRSAHGRAVGARRAIASGFEPRGRG